MFDLDEVLKNRLLLSSLVASSISTFRKTTGSKKSHDNIEIEFQKSKDRKEQSFMYSYMPSGTLIQFDDQSMFIPAFSISDILDGNLGEDEEFDDPNDFDDINDDG